ncbi:novel immune-type receptor 7a isoform X3 [Danio rerio]|uniref:Novel immune-type receptor 7a isoform X3 n=1 Tax=Danio rerio TaxID=7955 RepID=A0AC58G3I7_DANRE
MMSCFTFLLIFPLNSTREGVIFVKHAFSTFTKTYSGTTVSLLCSNILKESSYIAWFKQTDDSLPLCIVTQYVGTNPDSIYLNGFQKTRIEMSVNATFSTLRIISVDVSDSGMFYCGSFIENHMKFHNQTQLVVVNVTNQFKEEDTQNTDHRTTEQTPTSCFFFCTLTLISSGFILLSTGFAIVVLIRLKKSNAEFHDHNEELHQLHKNKDSDLNFAPVHFAKNNSGLVRTFKDVETHAVYAVR